MKTDTDGETDRRKDGESDNYWIYTWWDDSDQHGCN